jgi:hypothetical protein
MRAYTVRKCRTLTPAHVDEIAIKYLRGATIEQLALEYQVSATPIRNALRIRRIPARKGGPRRVSVRNQSSAS